MKKNSTLVLSIVIICSIGFILFMYSLKSWPIDLGLGYGASYELDITPGSSLNKVLYIIEENTDFNHSSMLKIAKYFSRFKSRKVQQGKHKIDNNTNIGLIIETITTPSEYIVDIVFPEGKDLEQIAIIISKKLGFDARDVIKRSMDRDFIRSLGINDALSLEGYLFPDTYRFHLTSTIDEVLARLVNNFFEEYNKYVSVKDNKTKLKSVHAIVTMASIIQGEAAHNDEMRMISSVYNNRIKRNMRLEADPTVQYAIPGPNKRLYNKDYKFSHPYNTYMNKGLPPGPINNPGRSAIVAAIQPKKTNYIFMVANPKTSYHWFAETIQGHNKNKRKRDRARGK